MQSETNQAKSKRDLIWEQKKRLREQKFQSKYKKKKK